jgi:NAD(P)-dependent dehydrogenase (short-subunit alcohol dehydrogenase family)
MHTPLREKIAVVTGASSGLGLEVATQLHNEGAKVFALARNVDQSTLPEGVIKISCNIRDLSEIDAAFAAIDEQTDHIDVLITCAGRGLTKPLEETSREEIMDVLGVNLKGNMYVAQEAYQRMLPKGSGHIITVGSTTSLRARANEPIYAASKWGLRGFTESLRMAAIDHGIRVTGVYPGGMDTAFWDGEQKDTSGYMQPQDIAAVILGALQTPSSIAPSEYVIERGLAAQ